MNKPGLKTYLAGWTAYLLFAFLLYPHLRITVMLFSIPLTMLGGWIYLYRGALITTLLTIPAHYILLSTRSGDPAVVAESINLFGIGSQLLFSLCTALLRASQLEYLRLNNSLEELVQQRTADLEKLTHYLVDAQQLESREISTKLLEKPMQDIGELLTTSRMLIERLAAKNHPRTTDAEHIARIVASCMEQLRQVNSESISQVPINDSITATLSGLKKQVEELHALELEVAEHTAWDQIAPEKVRYLSEIILEAVSNALRHADPAHIRVGIEQTPDQLLIYIENDGDPFRRGKEGMGLPLMRYRASKIGADVTIESSQSHTTRVMCRLKSGTAADRPSGTAPRQPTGVC